MFPFGYLMPEEEAKPTNLLRAAEDKASDVLNGTAEGSTCTISRHPAATLLEKLVLMRALKIEFPHQSTNIVDLEIAIRKQIRVAESK